MPAAKASPAARTTKTRTARIGVDPVAGVDERVVHRPRQRVARVGTVEGQERDGAVEVEQRLRSGHDGDLTGAER